MRTRTERHLGRAGGGLGLAVFCALMAPGCGGPSGGAADHRSLTAALDDLARGRREYERGHYTEAVAHLEEFASEHPGSRHMDEALFLMGKSHQALGEYLLASDAFSRLIEDYPQGRFAEPAAYELGRSAFLGSKGPQYDQAATHDAIAAFRAYLSRYPSGEFAGEARALLRRAEERLARKAYLNGQTYLKLGQPEPARFYFNKALGYRNDVPVVADGYLGLARSYKMEGDLLEAERAYEDLLAWLQDEGVEVLGKERHGELLKEVRDRMRSLSVEMNAASKEPGQE